MNVIINQNSVKQPFYWYMPNMIKLVLLLRFSFSSYPLVVYKTQLFSPYEIKTLIDIFMNSILGVSST